MTERIFPFVIILATSVVAAYVVDLMDHIVHGTLYYYRLQFSYNWIDLYWSLLKAIQVLLSVIIITTIAGTAPTLRTYPTARKPYVRIVRLREPSVIVAIAMLCFGAITLSLSIVYTESVFAFIGLGLTFWGALLLFIRPKKYIQLSLLDSIAISSLETIDQIIGDLGYGGQAVYLPPKYSKNLQEASVFIAYEKNTVVPPLEKAAEGKPIAMSPKGIFLTPPGLGLANLYESRLGKDFTKVDLAYLQESLPQLFVEDLEMADDFQMVVKGNLIQVGVIGSVFKDLCSEAMRLPNLCGTIGCHLCSSIAVALARALAKPIRIQETKVSRDSDVMEVCFRIVEE